jgi:hypothetical protein
MTVHIFKFDDWFMNKNEDWDADFHYLVVDGNSVELVTAGSQYWEEKMRENYPDRIEHEGSISRHRGHLECSAKTDKLKNDFPEVWDRLDKWCNFKDRRQ